MPSNTSRRWGRRAGALLLFVAVVLAGDRLLAAGLEWALSGSGLRFARLYHGDPKADVLILGNSRGVNCCYAPAIEETTGLEAFNLSYNGLSPALAEVLLRDYLDRHQPPKLLIIEVSYALVGPTGASLLTPWLGASERAQDLLAAEQPKLAGALQVSALLRYNSELFFRALYYLQRPDDQDWVNRGRLTDDQIALTTAMAPMTLESSERNLRIIAATVEAARARGVEVVLLMSPYWPGYRERIANLESWMQEIEVATGAQVLDLSDAVTEQSLFGDRIHLNEMGSRVLVDELVEAGALPRPLP